MSRSVGGSPTVKESVLARESDSYWKLTHYEPMYFVDNRRNASISSRRFEADALTGGRQENSRKPQKQHHVITHSHNLNESDCRRGGMQGNHRQTGCASSRFARCSRATPCLPL